MPSVAFWMLMAMPAVVVLLVITIRHISAVDGRASMDRGAHRYLDSPYHPRSIWLLILLPFIQLMAHIEFLSPYSESNRFRVSNAITVVILMFFVVNNWELMPRRLRMSSSVVVLGVLLNSIPRVVLGGMPFSPAAARLSGMSDALQVHHPGYVPLLDSNMVWLPMSDFIPMPGVRAVISLGDIAMLAGLTIVIAQFASMRLARQLNGPEGRPLAHEKSGV